LRRRVNLLIGQRALLIGHRTRRVLLIHPPAALDELCATSDTIDAGPHLGLPVLARTGPYRNTQRVSGAEH
jgi:hypothetical protein